MANKTELQVIIETFFQDKGIKLAEKDIKQFERAVDDVNKASARASTAFRGLGSILATAGLTFGAAEVIGFAKESIALAEEQARVEAQLEAVIKSTGAAAGVTAQEVKELASSLQAVTNFGDEATITGQNLLLTFTNIGRSVFPEATRTMLDMSAALGQDLKSSAIQLGKALNDPIEGVSALGRVGVQFSESQEKMIQSLASTGDLVGAQTLILEELQRQFGGSAEAAREAASGMAALQNAIGDLQEVIGSQALPVTRSWTDAIRESVEAWTFVLGTALPAITEVNQEIQRQTVQSSSSYEEFRQQIGLVTAELAEQNTLGGQSALELAAALDLTEEAYNRLKNAISDESNALVFNRLQTLTAASAQNALNNELERALRARGASTSRLQAQADTILKSQALEKTHQTFLRRREQDEMAAAFETEQAKADAAEEAAEQGQKAIVGSMRKAGQELEGIISGVIRPTLSEVWKPPEGDDTRIDESARRLATVATTGFGSEWLTQLNQQFAGMSFWEPIAQAMQTGDETALREAANQILTNQVTQLWDKELIKSKVREQLQQQQIRESLIEEVSKELGAEGVTASMGIIAQAAGDTTAATAEVEQGINQVGEAAAMTSDQVKTAFEGALTPVEQLNQKLREMAGLIDLVNENAKKAGGSVSNNLGLPVGAGVDARAQLGSTRF